MEKEEILFEFDGSQGAGCTIESSGPEIKCLRLIAKRIPDTPYSTTSIAGSLYAYNEYPSGNGFHPFNIKVESYKIKHKCILSFDILGVRLHKSGQFIAMGLTQRRNRS